MSYLIVAYYTCDNIYTSCAKNFIKSAQKFNLPYMVTPIENRGSWLENTQFKPTFLKQQMEKLKVDSLVYIDIDAEFIENPELFQILSDCPNTLVGAHNLDHKKFGRGDKFELLSGTLYLKNCKEIYDLIENWEKECAQNKGIWDQKALENVLNKQKISYYPLPEEYCVIFDYMKSVKNPVILHHQASRKVKDNEAARNKIEFTEEEIQEAIKKRVRLAGVPVPKKVQKGGITRYHRKWRNI